ncbi:acyltransferase domain-containing protein [Streptomyces racemochromogenes]|uniref:Acyltransferase domain-containing protein n=1 Tax=Streptomyces racemochromogenes TaxID=67353 RepID=A0ABW7PE43_9ACTN
MAEDTGGSLPGGGAVPSGPAALAHPGPRPLPHPLPYAVSGTTPDALRARARRLRAGLDADGDAAAGAGLCRALAGPGAAFAHRAVVVAADRAELARGLDALALGRQAPGLVRGSATREGGLAVLFAGQGSRRPGTGRGLYEAFPAFAAAFDEVCAQLGDGLRDLVFGDDAGALDRTGTAQPALFAVEVALYRLVEAWGVVPRFVGGHSVGEIAAAHVAGVLSLADAAALVTARGRLMDALPAGGVMVRVAAGEERVARLLVPDVAIASVDGPDAVVVSGAREAVCGVVARLAELDVKSKVLPTGHAFHSPLMDPVLEEFRAAVAGLDFRPPRIAFVSALTGGLVTDAVARPEYWVRHVRETVRFQDAVRALEAEGACAFLELGPEGLLTAMTRACLADAGAAAVLVPALCRQGDEVRALLTATASLYVHGALARLPLGIPAGPLDAGRPADAADEEGAGTETETEARTESEEETATGAGTEPVPTATATGMTATGHPLAAYRLDLPETGSVLFTGTVCARTHPWPAGGEVPAGALVEAALAAGAAIGLPEVAEATAEASLVLPERGRVRLQLLVQAPAGSGRRRLTVASRPEAAGEEEPWVRHLTAVLAPRRAPAGPEDGPRLTAWPPEGAEPLEVDGEHPALERAWRRGEEFFAEAALPDGRVAQAGSYALHPDLLDAALHPVLAAGEGASAPTAWSGAALYATGAASLRVRAVRGAFGVVELELADAEGGPVAAATVTLSAVPDGAGRGGRPVTPLHLVWERAADAPEAAASVTRALVGVRGDGGRGPSVLPDGDGTPAYPGPADLPAAGAPPELVLAPLTWDGSPREVSGALVRAAVGEARELVGAWLADERCADTALAVVTSGAEAVLPGEDVPDVAGAAVRGFVRSVQAWLAEEGARRLILVDVDDSDASRKALVRALGGAEPELALRDGVAYARRLVRAEPVPAGALAADGPESVRLSGASDGPCAGEAARQLVEGHGVRLAGPGEEAAAIVHLAGPEGPSLEAAVDAALALDRHGTPLAFVTTVGGVVGAGCAEETAVLGAFLTALAARRRAAGLPAAVLGWGADPEGVPAGLVPLAGAAGPAPLGHALARSLTLVSARADAGPLRAAGGPVPALLRALVPVPPRRAANRWSAGGVSPRERLAALPAGERTAVLTDLVRGHAAAALGHTGAEALSVERPFTELGLRPAAAGRLAGALCGATGLTIAPLAVFDHPSVTRLAGHLAGLLDGAPRAADAARRAGGTFAGLLRGAHAQGRTAEGVALLMAAAELVPGYDSRAGVAHWPAPAELAPHRGGAAGLFAFPSLGAGSGPHEYLALAGALAGGRGLTVFAHPGFAGEAVLPRSRQALVRAQAEAVASAAGAARPVLLGHSSGGWVAHAVARELLEIGREAAAVVLLDTYARGEGRHGLAVLTERVLDPDGPLGVPDDGRFLAMGGHLRVFADWTPEPAAAPTLLVRAAESAASAAGGWEYADHVAQVPGDHFSLLDADAGAVAATVDRWLRKVAR